MDIIVLALFFVFFTPGIIILYFVLTRRERAARALASNSALSKRTYKNQEKWAEAQLQRYPDDKNAKLVLAQVYYQQSLWEKSFTLFHALFSQAFNPVKRTQDEFVHRVRYGISAYKSNSNVVAKKIFDSLEQWGYGNYEFYYFYGLILAENDNHNKAVEQFYNAHKKDNRKTDPIKQIGICYYHIGNFSRAVEVLEDIRTQNVGDEELDYMLARCYVARNDTGRAEELLKSLIKSPDYVVMAYEGLSDVAFRMNNIALAVERLHNALGHIQSTETERAPEIEYDILYKLADLYIKNNDFKKAVEVLRKIERHNPNYKNIQELIFSYSRYVDKKSIDSFLYDNDQAFLEVCKKIINVYIKNSDVQQITPVSTKSDEYFDFSVTLPKPSLELRFFRFVRTQSTTGELLLRDLYEQMRGTQFTRVVCISAGGFSPGAEEFASRRQVDLVGRQQLQVLLTRI